MNMNDLGTVQFGAARPQPALQSARGWRGFLEALMTRLMRQWSGLYAAPPRRLPPLI
jgi:hypothetical protein